jgi:hypothetical protein
MNENSRKSLLRPGKQMNCIWLHCKKASGFSAPAGMSLTKLSLAGNNLIIPGRESLVSVIPAGNGKPLTFFYSVKGLQKKAARLLTLTNCIPFYLLIAEIFY